MPEPQPRSYAPRATSVTHPAAFLADGADALICFSGPRWDLAFQRTQQLMARAAKGRRVIYWQAPTADGLTEEPHLHLQPCRRTGVVVAAPHLPQDLEPGAAEGALRRLLEDFCASEKIAKPLLWYCDPDMLGFSRRVEAAAVIYDCAGLSDGHGPLLDLADLVFTTGYALYDALRRLHDNVLPFPSGVDLGHFTQARALTGDPGPHDQAAVTRPRLGLHGVVDARIDLEL